MTSETRANLNDAADALLDALADRAWAETEEETDAAALALDEAATDLLALTS